MFFRGPKLILFMVAKSESWVRNLSTCSRERAATQSYLCVHLTRELQSHTSWCSVQALPPWALLETGKALRSALRIAVKKQDSVRNCASACIISQHLATPIDTMTRGWYTTLMQLYLTPVHRSQSLISHAGTVPQSLAWRDAYGWDLLMDVFQGLSKGFVQLVAGTAQGFCDSWLIRSCCSIPCNPKTAREKGCKHPISCFMEATG